VRNRTLPLRIKEISCEEVLLAIFVGLVVMQFAVAQHAESAKSGFSFAVYGDSRSMMYHPYKQDQEAEARKLMVDRFEPVLPVRVAPELLLGGDFQWTHFWKGFSSGGAYLFAALASRGFARQKTELSSPGQLVGTKVVKDA